MAKRRHQPRSPWPGNRALVATALSLALAACADAEEETEGAVVDSHVLPTVEVPPGPENPSLADPATGSVTRPAPDAAGGDDAYEAAPADLDAKGPGATRQPD